MQAQNLLTDSPNGGESNDKDEAVAFYAQNNVTEALEALLNTMYGDKPVDIYGYMVRSIYIYTTSYVCVKYYIYHSQNISMVYR